MKTKLLTAAIAILLIVVAVMAVKIERHKTSYAKLEAEYATYRQDSLDELLRLERANQQTNKEIIENAEKEKIERDRADADRDARWRRMLAEKDAQLHNAQTRAIARGCEAEFREIELRDKLYRELAEDARSTSREVEERKAAGLACERAYEGVRQ